MESSTLLQIEKQEMIRVIHEEHEFPDRFVAHMLKRNVRIEEDLVDSTFQFQREAIGSRVYFRWLGTETMKSRRKSSSKFRKQARLAEMVGTTRSRVSYFMNKFRKLRFIKYNGGLEIHDSLLRVIPHD